MDKNKFLIHATIWISETPKNINSMGPFINSSKKGKANLCLEIKTMAAPGGGSTDWKGTQEIFQG